MEASMNKDRLEERRQLIWLLTGLSSNDELVIHYVDHFIGNKLLQAFPLYPVDGSKVTQTGRNRRLGLSFYRC